jgi:hypothetical protein
VKGRIQDDLAWNISIGWHVSIPKQATSAQAARILVSSGTMLLDFTIQPCL